MRRIIDGESDVGKSSAQTWARHESPARFHGTRPKRCQRRVSRSILDDPSSKIGPDSQPIQQVIGNQCFAFYFELGGVLSPAVGVTRRRVRLRRGAPRHPPGERGDPRAARSERAAMIPFPLHFVSKYTRVTQEETSWRLIRHAKRLSQRADPRTEEGQRRTARPQRPRPRPSAWIRNRPPDRTGLGRTGTSCRRASRVDPIVTIAASSIRPRRVSITRGYGETVSF